MSEQPLELRRINWYECCGFPHIFGSFRMAIRPGKLSLALLGVVLTFLWGWILDGIWQRHRPLPGELDAYWQVTDLRAWREGMATKQANRVQAMYASLPGEMPADLAKRLKENPNAVVDQLRQNLADEYRKATSAATPEVKAERARDFNLLYTQVEELRNRGIFTSFIAYEAAILRQAMDASISLNITGGLREVFNARHDVGDPTMLVRTPSAGVLASVVLVLRGKQWLLTQHFWFSVFLGVGTLLIWSLIGGGICRMAALNFARDERISPKAALEFARQKYVGFLTAPLLPLGMVLAIGVLLWLGGLFMSIPYLGELIGTLTLPLGLVGGFLIALILIGFLAGGSLFYPTIAVEGSDSFDAMSRSYSYIFVKAWRAFFYALVAFAYGALCTLFVRLFALIMLKSTRLFISAGTDLFTNRPGTGRTDASKLEAMWSSPTFEALWRPPAPFGMMHWERLGSWFIALWAGLVIALVIAFVASFFFSASTIIYFLLRREVDATDLNDVYLDEDETQLADAGIAPAGAMSTPAGGGGSGPVTSPAAAVAPADSPPPTPEPGEPPPPV